MTLSKVCVSASPEKKAIPNSGTVPVLRRSCRRSFGKTKMLPGPAAHEPSSRSSSPLPAMMYCVSSRLSVCQPRCPPGAIEKGTTTVLSAPYPP
jgi:hypothetical protein